MARIAIIGSGISGLIAARALNTKHSVVLFEKARGVGGRDCTRRNDNGYEFDHGAQFFTVRSQDFQQLVNEMMLAKIVSRWDANFVEINPTGITNARKWDAEWPHYVGSPSMNAIAKYLSSDLNIQLNTEVHRLEKASVLWQLFNKNGEMLGEFDWVISTAPSAQTFKLLDGHTAIADPIGKIVMQGCYALMLGLQSQPNLDWDAALVQNSTLSWVSRCSSKPGRPLQPTLVALASNSWADLNMEMPDTEVSAHMLQALRPLVGELDYDHIALHRWRYANIKRHFNSQGFFIDAENCLAACGDWCISGRIESAFRSACSLTGYIKNIF